MVAPYSECSLSRRKQEVTRLDHEGERDLYPPIITLPKLTDMS